jgi:dienelactone hydrolase
MRIVLILMFAALLAGRSAAAAPAPNGPERVDIPRKDGVLHGLLYRPAGPGPFPAIIALHGCHGLTGRDGEILPHYRTWAEHLRQAGNVVLFPDSYGSRNLGPQCRAKDQVKDHAKEHVKDHGSEHVRERRVRTRRDRVADVLATRQWLLQQSWVSREHISLLGWANGASALLWAVRPQLAHGLDPDFRSAVVLYPDCRASARLGWSTRVPTLVLIGARDDVSSPAACHEMIEDARGRSALAQIVIYPGAAHAFDRPGGSPHPSGMTSVSMPLSHRQQRGNAKARIDSQKRVADWLAR